MSTAFAPGKCILFGEHAVVYGHPAVAVSIDSGVEITIEESEDWEINNQYNTDGYEKFNPKKHPHIQHIIRNLFEYEGKPLRINVQSNLFSVPDLVQVPHFRMQWVQHCTNSLNQVKK